MRYIVTTAYSPCTIRITIRAKKQCIVNLVVSDAKQANTDFIRRDRVFQAGEENPLYVQMPQPGKAVVVSIFEEGMAEDSSPVNFDILKIKKMGLARQMGVIDYTNKYIREWLPFMNKFCYNAGVLPINRIYESSKGTFKIKYVQDIMNEGQVSLTPMRIGIFDHIIEASATKLVPMTVPERKAVASHEMSHIYLNEKMKNESEADINGAIIYLGEGNPVVELKNTYLNIFNESDTPANRERYEKVKGFIDGYEELRVKYV